MFRENPKMFFLWWENIEHSKLKKYYQNEMENEKVEK